MESDWLRMIDRGISDHAALCVCTGIRRYQCVVIVNEQRDVTGCKETDFFENPQGGNETAKWGDKSMRTAVVSSSLRADNAGNRSDEGILTDELIGVGSPI